MRIILKKNIKNLGKWGDEVIVKPGHARNFLIPFQKAVSATKNNLIKINKEKIKLKKEEDHKINIAKKQLKIINKKDFTINVKSKKNGILFGSIQKKQILKSILKFSKQKIDKSQLIMPKKSIKKTGNFKIKINLYRSIQAKVNIYINSIIEKKK